MPLHNQLPDAIGTFDTGRMPISDVIPLYRLRIDTPRLTLRLLPIDTVLGVWEDGNGRTIEFREDWTFTAVGDTFGPGFGHSVSAGAFDGTWRLCADHRGHDWEQDASVETGCDDDAVEGRWIALDAPGSAVEGWLDDVFFTGAGDELRLYPWFIDVGPDEDDFYAKAD